MEQVRVPEGRSGAWSVERFEVSKTQSQFTAIRDPARYVPAGRYTALKRGGSIIMSDTRAEMRDHYEPERRARGRVLLNGLGLGVLLQAVLAKTDVDNVTVIEIAPEVIELVGPTYAGDPRLTIICADAYEWQPPKSVRYDVVWHDIWDDLCLDNLPQMERLHRKYGRRCDWQDSWGKRYLLERRRRSG